MERIADFVIRAVNEAGAGHIFLITGRGILYLTDAVAANKQIQAVSTYNEQGASFAAMAYASCTGKPAVCLVSTGCAATNAITACLCAYQDNLPLVFISGQNMLNETVRHTGVPIRTYGSQEADIISLVQPITKYAVMLESKEDAVFEVQKAIFQAQDGRKGPVWIDIPLDVQNMRIEPGNCRQFMPSQDIVPDKIDEGTDEVVAALNQAERPLVLIGGGVSSAGAGQFVKEISETYHIPVAFSPAACDVYGSANALSVGAVGSIGGSRAGNFAVQNADFILAVGTKLCLQETGVREKFARDAKIYVVDVDPNEHTKRGVQIDKVIHADAKAFFTQLLRKQVRPIRQEWIEQISQWKEVFSIEKEPFVRKFQEENKTDLYGFAYFLSSCLSEDATVITDAGLEELVVPSSIYYQNGQKCLFPAAQGAMGYAIPAIIGAYYAGRKNISCIVGDGSFMMNMQELQLIGSKQIPVRIFVINNNMYSIIRKRQHDLFRNRTIGNDPSDGLPEPDFQKIAENFGFTYYHSNTYVEMKELVSERFRCALKGPELIEIMCVSDQPYLHESYTINERHRLVHRPIEDMAPFLDRDQVKREMIVDPLPESL